MLVRGAENKLQLLLETAGIAGETVRPGYCYCCRLPALVEQERHNQSVRESNLHSIPTAHEPCMIWQVQQSSSYLHQPISESLDDAE